MEFQNKLLRWFKKRQRPLPWRQRYRPYEVWVSEIMLQQTQVETALPYFRRWMRLFPTVKSLAESAEEKVLKAWQGLGYYSRARNLRESAKKIMREHGGVFPQKFDEILALKGVGRYTAGAVASIAFNEDRPIVDGNVLRVLSRIYAVKKPIDLEKNKEFFWALEKRLIPKGRARDFNQGLMELGALICLPQNPRCAVCPIEKFCAAKKSGSANRYPVRAKKRRTVKVQAASLVISDGKKFLIQRRPVGRVMGGLWEFPEWKLSKNKPLAGEAVAKKVHELGLQAFGPSLERPHAVGKIHRSYTRHRETLWVFKSRLADAAPAKSGWPRAWASREDFKEYPFSSAHAKIVSMIEGSDS